MAGALVIVNPESRNGATGRRWHALEPLLRSRFEAAGLGPVAVAHTRGMRDAERIAREGARDGFTRLVVAGGDGTLGEVATGLLQAGLGAATALGVLPLGRGCDFARTIGMPLDPNKAIAQLAGGGERSIDAGQVTTTVQRAAGSGSAAGDEEKDQEERFFLNEANIGVSSLVVRMVNRAGPLARRMGGTAVFAQATLRSLAAYRPARVRLRVDGEEVYDGPLIQAAIANGRYFGGGMRYAPEAETRRRALRSRLDPGMVEGQSRNEGAPALHGNPRRARVGELGARAQLRTRCGPRRRRPGERSRRGTLSCLGRRIAGRPAGGGADPAQGSASFRRARGCGRRRVSSGAHFDDLFARIREAAALVAARAEFVRIDEDALRRMCEQLAGSDFAAPGIDPAHRPFPSDETTLAYVVTVDALNFGSGWFPVLRKRDGASGYMTISTALRERFEKEGPFTAAEMSAIEPEDVAALFGQALENREAMELMSHFARALRDLGELLQTNYDGRFEELVESAAGRACALVERLHAMPLYRDVANYHGLDVPLYKRAQITASDLAHAFGGEGLGHFEDLDELTLFADNLVPHVLRRSGVLAYDPELAARIDAAETPRFGLAGRDRDSCRRAARRRGDGHRAPQARSCGGHGRRSRRAALEPGAGSCDQGASATPRALRVLLMTAEVPDDAGPSGAEGRAKGPPRGAPMIDSTFWIMFAVLVALSALANLARRSALARGWPSAMASRC